MQAQSSVIAAPPYYALRIAAFYGGYFLFGGVALPFFPVWLEVRGLSDVEIASCIAVPLALRVFLTPLAGMFADWAPNRRFAVRIFMVASVIAFLFAWPATSYWPLLITTGVATILWHLSLPVAEALALTGVRRFGLDFGRMRFSGSITFIIANLGAGAILSFVVPEAIFWLLAAGLIATMVTGFTLPVTPPALRALDDAARPQTRSAREVLGNPALLALLAASGLVQATHGVVYTFGSIYWLQIGFTDVEIGALWAIGVICEIMLFLWSGAVVRRTGDYGLLMIGSLAAVLRWSLFPFEMGFVGFLLVQCLHGLTFGATYLGTQHAIARIVPEEMTASAQGIYAMMTGILMAGIVALAGPLYVALQAGAFATMAVPASLAVVVLLIYRRLERAS
jgi:MFS transporter, PPP family, 3-phenylpropionic acid transporter